MSPSRTSSRSKHKVWRPSPAPAAGEVVEPRLVELLIAAMNLDPMHGDLLAARIAVDSPFGLALDGLDGFQAQGDMGIFLVLLGVQLFVAQQISDLPRGLRLEIRRKGARHDPVRERPWLDALFGSIDEAPLLGGNAVGEHPKTITAKARPYQLKSSKSDVCATPRKARIGPGKPME